ncbi:MAG: DUF2974 domain-containing protein [Coprobacillus sp.]|nr:DUF2974 domain-containing protein [Coprobacillus sp.]
MAKESIIDYVKKYSTESVLMQPIDERDALVFAMLSYLYYERIEITKDFTIQDINANLREINRGTSCIFANQRFVPALADSPRFKHFILRGIEHKFDQENNIQFFACTFVDEVSKTVIICFRGTTSDLCGWIEDIELTTLKIMPADKLGAEYAQNVIENYGKGYHFYIAGHSKGGNVAAYCAYALKRKELKRVEVIYDFDGPNFDKKLHAKKGTEIIKKFVPQYCLVGNLLENGIPYKVIDSRAKGMTQHDPFNWIMKNGQFVYLKSISSRAKSLKKTLDRFLDEFDEKEKKLLVEQVKYFAEQMDEESLGDLLTRPVKLVRSLISTYQYGRDINAKKSLQLFLSIFKEERKQNKELLKEDKKKRE